MFSFLFKKLNTFCLILQDPQPDTTSIDITLTSADTTSWSAPLNQYKFLLDDTYEGFRKEIDIPNDVMLSSNISVNASGKNFFAATYSDRLTARFMLLK